MSDTERMYKLLKERGPRGAHTHELRSMGYSGNPSQRVADIEAKYGVTVQRERETRNGRQGSRYRLQEGRRSGSSGVMTVKPASRVKDRSEPAPSRSVPSMFDADDFLDWGDAA